MIVCPACGEQVPEEETCWLYNAKLYCSEACVRQAATGWS